MQHKLGIEVLETANERLLRLVDMSVYNSILGVTCPRLLITAPGYQFSASIGVERLVQGFNLTLTACDLEIQTRKCDIEFSDIPDGIYAIQYSISPNEYTAVNIQHLRLTKAYNRLRKAYCALDLGACIPERDKEDKLKQLTLVDSYFQAAKAKVEICGEASKGMTLYKYGLKLLDRIDCKTCN